MELSRTRGVWPMQERMDGAIELRMSILLPMPADSLALPLLGSFWVVPLSESFPLVFFWADSTMSSSAAVPFDCLFVFDLVMLRSEMCQK